MKAHVTYDSSNRLCVVIFPTCGEEYADETVVAQSGLVKQNSETTFKFINNILGNLRYQKRVEEHLRTCGKGTFKIFQM